MDGRIRFVTREFMITLVLLLDVQVIGVIMFIEYSVRNCMQ